MLNFLWVFRMKKRKSFFVPYAKAAYDEASALGLLRRGYGIEPYASGGCLRQKKEVCMHGIA